MNLNIFIYLDIKIKIFSMDNDLFCRNLISKIADLSLMKVKYENKAVESQDEIDHIHNYEIYKDIKSDLKYKKLLYRNHCTLYFPYFSYLSKLFTN